MTGSDSAAFIRAHTRLLPVPHAPEIALHLADEAMELWRKTEEELDEIGLPPPFWAFAWAGGQALARYILDHRATVAGRRVLDFASGSGLVAIAAAKAGAAARGRRCDIDAFAIAAIALNAAGQRRRGRGALDRPCRRRCAAGRSSSPATSAIEQDIAERVSPGSSRLDRRGAAVLDRRSRPQLPAHATGSKHLPPTRCR